MGVRNRKFQDEIKAIKGCSHELQEIAAREASPDLMNDISFRL